MLSICSEIKSEAPLKEFLQIPVLPQYLPEVILEE